MANHDVAVATPSDDTNEQRPDRSLAEQLVDQARQPQHFAQGSSTAPSSRSSTWCKR